MKKKLFHIIFAIVFFNFTNIENVNASELYISNVDKISSSINILAIANKTSNMGLVIIGMIVVILALVGYTFLKNK